MQKGTLLPGILNTAMAGVVLSGPVRSGNNENCVSLRPVLKREGWVLRSQQHPWLLGPALNGQTVLLCCHSSLRGEAGHWMWAYHFGLSCSGLPLGPCSARIGPKSGLAIASSPSLQASALQRWAHHGCGSAHHTSQGR